MLNAAPIQFNMLSDNKHERVWRLSVLKMKAAPVHHDEQVEMTVQKLQMVC